MPDEITSTTPGSRALAPTRDHEATLTDKRRDRGQGSPLRPALLGVVPELVLAAVAVYLFVLARNFQYEPQPGQLGPGFWPQLLCAGIFVCALVRVAQKLRVRAVPVSGGTKAEEGDHFRWQRLALALALVVGYVFGTVFLGYILATTLFFVAFVWLGGQRRWYVVPLGLTVSLVFAFVFLKVVYVSLPSGVGVFDQLSVLLYRLIGVY
ncbi:MAG TPA: tripartite tricarboxylate transporter TctB family protein [Rubrobacter sp.]|nr:tripartite tricarboxylate transporter TctB family protein [Rubrobacter sp.]